jgi:hypothetical protein
VQHQRPFARQIGEQLGNICAPDLQAALTWINAKFRSTEQGAGVSRASFRRENGGSLGYCPPVMEAGPRAGAGSARRPAPSTRPISPPRAGVDTSDGEQAGPRLSEGAPTPPAGSGDRMFPPPITLDVARDDLRAISTSLRAADLLRRTSNVDRASSRPISNVFDSLQTCAAMAIAL